MPAAGHDGPTCWCNVQVLTLLAFAAASCRYYCPVDKHMATIPGVVKHRLNILTKLALIVVEFLGPLLHGGHQFDKTYGKAKDKKTLVAFAHEVCLGLQHPKLLFGAAILRRLHPLSQFIYATFQEDGGFGMATAAAKLKLVDDFLAYHEDNFDEAFEEELSLLRDTCSDLDTRCLMRRGEPAPAPRATALATQPTPALNVACKVGLVTAHARAAWAAEHGAGTPGYDTDADTDVEDDEAGVAVIHADGEGELLAAEGPTGAPLEEPVARPEKRPRATMQTMAEVAEQQTQLLSSLSTALQSLSSVSHEVADTLGGTEAAKGFYEPSAAERQQEQQDMQSGASADADTLVAELRACGIQLLQWYRRYPKEKGAIFRQPPFTLAAHHNGDSGYRLFRFGMHRTAEVVVPARACPTDCEFCRHQQAYFAANPSLGAAAAAADFIMPDFLPADVKEELETYCSDLRVPTSRDAWLQQRASWQDFGYWDRADLRVHLTAAWAQGAAKVADAGEGYNGYTLGASLDSFARTHLFGTVSSMECERTISHIGRQLGGTASNFSEAGKHYRLATPIGMSSSAPIQLNNDKWAAAHARAKAAAQQRKAGLTPELQTFLLHAAEAQQRLELSEAAALRRQQAKAAAAAAKERAKAKREQRQRVQRLRYMDIKCQALKSLGMSAEGAIAEIDQRLMEEADPEQLEMVTLTLEPIAAARAAEKAAAAAAKRKP